jgi:hypothetical protein
VKYKWITPVVIGIISVLLLAMTGCPTVPTVTVTQPAGVNTVTKTISTYKPTYSKRDFYLRQAESEQRKAQVDLDSANSYLQMANSWKPTDYGYKINMDSYQRCMKQYYEHLAAVNDYLIKAQREP